jgi:hypothetical protein
LDGIVEAMLEKALMGMELAHYLGLWTIIVNELMYRFFTVVFDHRVFFFFVSICFFLYK